MPLDGFLAVCESKSVARAFVPVQALKHIEYAGMEYRVYTGAVVLHGKYVIIVPRSA
jgi:hypothetical protein